MHQFSHELASLKQWVCWRLEPAPEKDKDSKIPYNPCNGRKASSTNPQTWTTVEAALAAKEKYLFTGVGFVFTKDDGLVGVDIDHCRNAKTGELSEKAVSIVQRANTYTEISPSGEGLHLFIKGRIPEGGNKNTKSGVEMYSFGRYFTMTGMRLDGTPDTVAEDNGTLAWIHETYIKPPKKAAAKRKKGNKPAKPLTDEEIIEKASATENGEAFMALWEGKWQESYSSQSEADMALCCKLAFWTGKNREQMDRLFRQSKLYREKWDVKHHADGATYGEETLSKAIETVSDSYRSGGDTSVFEYEGRYFRSKGEAVYALTNFIVKPVEMIVSEDETQLTADLVTFKGEIFRQTFMTTDFSNLQKFKNILNKRTIALSYTGSEGDLELLKNYISDLDWVRKTGVKALGLYHIAGRWVYVDSDGAMEAGGNVVQDVVQLEKYRNILSSLLSTDSLSPETLCDLGPLLLGYNEAPKTVAVLAWCAGCFLKSHLKKAQIKYPHLFLIGEAGSGKSNTLERVILPVFGPVKVAAATQVTAFTLMKDSASSNLVPQPLDEFKPSKIDKYKLDVLYNHMRDAYDGHEGTRGRADQSTVYYELTAPLIVAGEESPDESAIRERSIELLFSKKDLKSGECRRVFMRLCKMSDALGNLGRSLLEAALCTDAAEAEAWYTEALTHFDESLPSRILNNLACCGAGLRLLERLCKMKSLSWTQVFNITLDACYHYLTYAAKEYLLDGSLVNKGIIEQSLEIMARMGLDPRTQWSFLEGREQVAIRFNKVYDHYTKYRRDYAITGECLPYAQFLKQLRNSDLFITYKQVRFPDCNAKAYVLDFGLLQQRTDITNFNGSDIEPLA
ncbi:DNA primase [Acetanaerobacterium elongatum]|uniref:NrS-1 polymerase-like HBD domain-containing protein n=1 Tax=Acetanaerobacterium elongatum TaxID=258515 RepID=A0A1G9YCT3_9FIRM|nr:DNA primase [Acetanaerobacterium elongatum]SDN06952.1 hypothetical protein SAMN05192585_11092 [Acetanaerobacterium elongatum]